MIYARLALLVGLLAAVGWGAYADYAAGRKAGQDAIQTQWDADRIKIQQVADAAIAQATKERDAAVAANEGIENDYQAKLSAATANAADFSRRLSNALTGIAANRNPAGQTSSGPGTPTASAAAVAQQLSTVVKLTSNLYTDCLANADQLDGLIAEIKPQL